MLKKNVFLLLLVTMSLIINGQQLKPGFDKMEYINLMKVSAQFGDSSYAASIPPPPGFRMLYRSAVMGLENLWDLWLTDNNIPIINIRGTTADELSWQANFYAAMVPAKGELQLSKDKRFVYQLATNPRAAVHVGWLVSTGFLALDMMPKIDSLYKAGHKEMLIMGHSQGGAIAFLVTAYLYNLQKLGNLPADIRFKTYCSAGPKPGNLYFAYDYEAMTQGGWAYNVVNSADWVPETPVSIQTVNDFNNVNPFVNLKSVIKKQSFIKRFALNFAYGKLTKYNTKAVKSYRKYLSDFTAKSVRKHLPGFEEPPYALSNDYVRTGNTIVLLADDDYFKVYPQESEKIFVNHFHPPYLYLANKLPLNTMDTKSMASSITGSWELNYISGIRIAFEGLYPEKKPFITIDEITKKISGNTSCNQFTGLATIEGSRINFPEALALTRMMCPGDGEQNFLKVLKTANKFSVSDNTLTLLMDDIAIMRFNRKQ